MPDTGADHLNNMENEHNKNQNTSTSSNTGLDEALLAYLKEMNETLHELAKNAQNTSQSNARNNIPRRDDFKKKAEQDRESRQFNAKKPKFRTKGDPLEDFLDSFEDSIIEGFLGADFKSRIGSVFEGLADMMGVELDEIPGAIGKELGKQAMDAFKGTELGKKATEKFGKLKDEATGKVKNAFQAGVDRYNQNPDWNIFKDKWAAPDSSQSAVKDAVSNAADSAANKMNGSLFLNCTQKICALSPSTPIATPKPFLTVSSRASENGSSVSNPHLGRPSSSIPYEI